MMSIYENTAADFLELRDEVERAEESLKKLKERRDDAEELLLETMGMNGERRTVCGDRMVTTTERLFVSVQASAKKKIVEYCQSHGLTHVLDDTVRVKPPTLKKEVKDMRDGGDLDEHLEELLNIHTKMSTIVR